MSSSKRRKHPETQRKVSLHLTDIFALQLWVKLQQSKALHCMEMIWLWKVAQRLAQRAKPPAREALAGVGYGPANPLGLSAPGSTPRYNTISGNQPEGTKTGDK